ncbi:MAG: CoA transferase [Chloroflexi bacterium]|nr:CoA transferase [Chloroflexota bacterium]
MLALEGIKVLDLTRVGPGPFCTMVLADLGAEVIMIEAPATVGARQSGLGQLVSDRAGKRTAAHQPFNRNKKSVCLDLKSKDGRNVFYKLAQHADVVVEGFRPGAAERLGVSYETMRQQTPRAIYCSITGYGSDGPYHDLPGHDVNYISMAGALDLIGEADRKPIIPLNLLADFGGGGMSAAVGILAALIARNSLGKGQHIDISLTDSAIFLLTRYATQYLNDGVVLKRGELVNGGAYPYYNVYQTKDGKFLTIGCLEPWLWENLCRAIEREDLIPYHFEADHLLHKGEGKEWAMVASSLEQVFLTKTRDEWFEILKQKDVPIGKVYSMDEVFNDPQVLHRGMVVEVERATEGKVKQVGIPIKLSDTPGKIRSLPPELGQHTEEILQGLGYGQDAINAMRCRGIIN